MAFSAYHVAYQIVTDYDLHVRVSASAQQESETNMPASPDPWDPEAWARAYAWDYGTQADWVEVVTYALETGNLAWGKDPAVVTDQHILSFVQSAMAEEATP